MKTKLKSLSKRSISVFLVLMMVVSTITVGIITTTAAFTEPDNSSVGASVDDDSKVGASQYYLRGSFAGQEHWGDNYLEMTQSGDCWYYVVNMRNGDRFKFYDGNNWLGPTGDTDTTVNADGGSANLADTTGTGAFKLSTTNSGNYVIWYKPSSKKTWVVSTSLYVDGYINVVDKKGTDGYSMTQSASDATVYEASITLTANDPYVAIYGAGSNKYYNFYKSNQTSLTANTWSDDYNSSGDLEYSKLLLSGATSGQTIRVKFSTKDRHIYWEVAAGGTYYIHAASTSNEVTSASGTLMTEVTAGTEYTYTLPAGTYYVMINQSSSASSTELMTTAGRTSSSVDIDTGSASGSDAVVNTYYNVTKEYNLNNTLYYHVYVNSSQSINVTFNPSTGQASFGSAATPFNGYYLAGRIVVDNGSGTDIYPDTTANGYSYNSTRIRFSTTGTTDIYKYETKKTVRELAALVGTDSDKAQNFVIHDQNHLWGDQDASKDFFDCREPINAVSSTAQTLANHPESDMNFANAAHQYDDSDGKVVIWLDATGVTDKTEGTGTLKIYYTLEDEHRGIGASATLSPSPSTQTTGKNITLTATLVDPDEYLLNDSTRTFTFCYGDAVLGTVDTTSNTATYTLTASALAAADAPSSGEGTNTVNVRISTTQTYTDGASSQTFHLVSARCNVTFSAPATYVSSDLTSGVTPGYTASNWTRVTDATADWHVSAADGASTYTFALSSAQAYDPEFAAYTPDSSRTKFVDITTSQKDVMIDGEPVAVRTYTFTPRVNCSSMKVYIDSATAKVYATAEYNNTGTLSNTFDSSKKVRYYFAEVRNKDTEDDTDALDSIHNGIKIYYWNSSVQGKNGRETGTAVNKYGAACTAGSDDHKIYVDQKGFICHDMSFNNGEGKVTTFDNGARSMAANIYYCDLPIWATCFRFVNSSNNAVTDRWEVLNPNRVYVMFEYGNTGYVSSAVLDESLWDGNGSSAAYNQNMTNALLNVKTNVIKYDRGNGKGYYGDNENGNDAVNANAALSTRYQATSTAYPLYFGNYAAWDSDITTSANPGGLYHNFNMRWNLAQRGGSDNNDPNTRKYDGGSAYYSSIWNLTGFLLDKSRTNTINGYLLTNPNNDGHMPLFDYDNLKTSGAADVYPDERFPFYKSTYNGITTYSYDSLADPNRLFNTTDGTYSIENTLGSYRKVGALPGYKPFSDQDYSIANEFEIDFNMTTTGAMTPTTQINGKDQDISFNFSGDDDVWVYVDGVKVLDLGGDHMISAGSINFTDMKVYYKTTANTAQAVATNNDIGYKTSWDSGYAGLGGSWAYSSSNVYTVDLQDLFTTAGVTFKNTDAATKHKLQMFYVERGQGESNLSLEFNLPQPSGLSIKNNVTTDHVNEALVDAAKAAASSDYFVYTVENRLSTDNDRSATIDGGGVRANARGIAASVTDADVRFTNPLYPANTNAIRNVEGFLYTLAKMTGSPGTSAAGYTLPTSTSTFVPVKNVNYYLSDQYLTTKATDLSGQVGDDGKVYLLSGEMANFRESIAANTNVAVKQYKELGETENDSNGIVKYKAVAKNDVGNYYETSYSITDDSTGTVLQSRTADVLLADSNNSLLALDSATSGGPGNTDSFYYTIYSPDSDKVSPAMTVDYYNDIAVGTLRVQKQFDKTYSDTTSKFRFTVELGSIFGDDEHFGTMREYEGLVYYVYNADGSLAIEAPQYYTEQSGIIIKAGQYAEIEGIPVETRFRVTERTAANHNLVSIVKTARKSDGTSLLNDVTDMGITSSTFYDETLNSSSVDDSRADCDAWNGKTAFDIMATSDGHKAVAADDMDYFVNMIPHVGESKTGNSATNYGSISKVLFTNAKQKFSVTFKYYNRARINDEPAQIMNQPTAYTVNFDGLTDYTKLFDEVTTVGTKTYAAGDFKCYDFKRLIQDAAIEFATDTNISNILDDYHMWTGQTEAVTALTSKSTTGLYNVKTGADYTASDVIYHTNYIGEVQDAEAALNERWVTYKSNGRPVGDPYGFSAGSVSEEAYADGDVSSYDAINSIVVWCYNQPKQYTVTLHGSAENTLLTQKTVTLNGSSKTVYVAASGGTATFQAYYNQRLGYEREYNDAGFFEAYGILGYTNDLPDTYIAEKINGKQFAYWAYDENGTQVASTSLKYYYRVTSNIQLYPVYMDNPSSLGYGLSVVQNEKDTFVNSNGVSKTRLNLMFNPYGLDDFDPNILDSAVLNIIIQDDQQSLFADDAAIRTMYNNNRTGLQTYLNEHAEATMKTPYSSTSPTGTFVMRGFEYTMKGNADDDGAITKVVVQLTNKNRMQFTSIFNTATLYKTNQTQKVLQVTAMKYGDTWILSDNCIIDTFICPSSTP